MNVSEVNESLDNLPLKRLRAEVLVDHLVSAGFCREEDILIVPDSSSAYFHERDISAIEEVVDPQNGRTWYQARTPRSGFFDALPERLFHEPAPRTARGEVWEEIRTEETRQEEEGRKFLLPFDSALNRQRLAIERFEGRVLAGREEGFLREFLSIFWPETEDWNLSATRRQSLFQLTVMAHRVAGDCLAMQRCFAEFLGDPVRLFYEDAQFEQAVDFAFAPLGDATLSVDALLNAELFLAGRQLRIELGPLSYERMSAYFPEARGERMLGFLCQLLVPVEVDWEIVLIPATDLKEEEGSCVSFTLREEGQYTVLGYTSLLG